jgi:hypothetical protein
MWLMLGMLACSPSPSAADGLTSPPPRQPGWTIAVWMDGDNDLESLVTHDLEELERAAARAGGDVRILVQADRIDGYATDDGDWTGTRRYDIVADTARGVRSPVVADLGERDMGSPDELADFLLWAEAMSPTEHLAVVMWNHGGGFWIAQDDTDGSVMAIHDELPAALAPVVAARGANIDIMAFDACNMAEWELAHTLAPQADVLVASEAWVGNEGLAYDLALAGVDGTVSAADLGARLVRSAAIRGELSMSAVDLALVPELTVAVDGLAAAWLANPARLGDFLRARQAADDMDRDWLSWWVDLASMGEAATRSPDPAVAAAGERVVDALEASVIAAEGRIAQARGLTIWAVTQDPRYGRKYQLGPWAADTRWDELLIAVSRATP